MMGGHSATMSAGIGGTMRSAVADGFAAGFQEFIFVAMDAVFSLLPVFFFLSDRSRCKRVAESLCILLIIQRMKIPDTWFVLVAPGCHGHALTVVNAAFEPYTRVEMRPHTHGEHQQWRLDSHGFLINRHSGCVLTVKSVSRKTSIARQQLIQGQRKDVVDAATQRWEVEPFDDDGCALRLAAFPEYYLHDKAVPCFDNEKIKWQMHVS
ncbi:hypothetical protein BC940DRAFT_293565 [Gongronella butleri]|nr:hypothetical protein BC940DRAFT_293565 [Gongronella butleri]